MTGKALSWIRGLWRNKLLSTWKNFIEDMHKRFGKDMKINWSIYHAYSKPRVWRCIWISSRTCWMTSMNNRKAHWLRISWGGWNLNWRVSSRFWSQRHCSKPSQQQKCLMRTQVDITCDGGLRIGKIQELIQGHYSRHHRTCPKLCQSCKRH